MEKLQRYKREAIKADTETLDGILHSLFKKIWKEENIPEEWKEGMLNMLPEKGNLNDCSNYRELFTCHCIAKSRTGSFSSELQCRRI
jgi:hypothetical protein